MRANRRPDKIRGVQARRDSQAPVALAAPVSGSLANEIPAAPGSEVAVAVEGAAADVVAATAEVAAEVQARLGRLARLLAFDERLLVEATRWQGPWRTRLARFLTRAGDAASWTAACIAFLAAGVVWRGPFLDIALRLTASTLLATGLSQWLKRTLNRPRPDSRIPGFEALAANPDRFSFPSGHTTAAVAVAVALVGVPFGLAPAAAVLAVGIGLSRVYLGAHYPLDVAAGAVIGCVAGGLARLAAGLVG
jgi:undecaprenyl-diphosphatase